MAGLSSFGLGSAAAGPSTNTARNVPNSTPGPSDLWSDILRSADKKKVYGKKNLLVLSERHRGRKHLLSQLIPPSPDTKRRRRPTGQALALGYEVLQVRDEGDEDGVPPISVIYPPSSGKGGLGLVKAALPRKAISDTAVMIVLDWTRPGSMVREFINWLKWVEDWVGGTEGDVEVEERREKLQSYLQNYSEPPVPSPSGTVPPPSSTYANAPLLPLGPGTLTLNAHGIPIIVVCTRADLMDSSAERIGMKGAIWEERCDWAQQVIRTICLTYGAALFYTSSTQPQTYTLLRPYILHRLHTSPSTEAPTPATTRFPFPHRANVLDRDAVMVPSGWDSWGKINVLRDGFDPASICKALERSLGEGEEGHSEDGLENIWAGMIPNDTRTKHSTTTSSTSHAEPEQSFLTRQYDILQKDPNRDPRAAFRQPAASSTSTAAATEDKYGGYGGVVGPMGSGGLSLPGVEKAMMEMEGQGAEDLKEKFAKLGRKGALSPGTPVSGDRAGGGGGGGVPNEALHSFFQGLLASKGKGTPVATRPAE